MNIQMTAPKLSPLTAEQFMRVNDLYYELSKCDVAEKNFKDLKRRFPDWETMAEDLDLFVSEGLIERYDRRYRFCIPTILSSELSKLNNEAMQLKGACDQLSEGAILKLLLSLDEQRSNLYFISDKKLEPDFKLAQVPAETYTFVDLTRNDEVVGLASYFVTQNYEHSPEKEVRSLIGDVDHDFFLILAERTYKQSLEKKPFKETIFSKTLALFNYVKIEPLTGLISAMVNVSHYDESLFKSTLNNVTEALFEQPNQMDIQSEIRYLLFRNELLSTLEKKTYIIATRNEEPHD